MRKNLKEWELSLKPYFQHIQLLGEIPVTRIEVECLGNLIRDLIKRYDLSRATRKLDQDYPYTFVIFLAAISAHNTSRDYWRVIAEATGNSKQQLYQQKWGKIFLAILKDNNLSTFSDVGGYHYVTPIRLHGGIPAYSLPDFFAYILWPSIKNPKYLSLTTTELVKTMLKRSSVQFAVDSPVTNFLENGGKHAIEFVDRCRKMARTFNHSGEVSDPLVLDLPPYVVRTFQQYVNEELETDQGRRLRAPRLYLDPYEPEFYLYLPPETVEGMLASRHYFWQISIQCKNEKYEYTERVRVRRRGYDLETSEGEMSLERPAREIVVSFCYQDTIQNGEQDHVIQTIRRWRLSLLPNDNEPSLLAFHPRDKRMLRWNQTLPAEELWLMSPMDVEIHVEGEADIIENFPDFYGSWGQWTVQSWDLSEAHAIQLVKDGKNLQAPIPILSAPPDPVLVGDNLLTSAMDPDDVPVYIGSPPWIRIPLRPGRNAKSELSNWEVKIESRWAAQPVLQRKIS